MYKNLLLLFHLLFVSFLSIDSLKAQYVYKEEITKGAATFYQPKAVFFDSEENLYIVDTHNHRIQKYDGLNWSIMGSKGTAAGQFDTPGTMAEDSQGNLYIIDGYNSRIQKYNGTVWSIIGSLGTGVGQFDHPVSIAIDSQDNLYVTDNHNSRLQKYDGKNWSVLGPSGANVGEFNQPYGVTVDKAGNVYVADTYNNRIQKYNGSSWTVLGSKGTSDGQFDLPRGVFVDERNILYVADTYNDRLQKYNGTTWKTINSFVNGELSHPTDVTIAKSGDLYLTDPLNNRVKVFSPLPLLKLAQANIDIASGASFSFGDVKLLSDNTVTFTIINDGVAPLQLTGDKVTVSGANATNFSLDLTNTVTTLDSEQSTTFKVTFKPSGAAHTAVLTVLSNDPQTPAYTITLSGNGVKLAQTITFQAIPDKSFGDAPLALVATASSGLPVTFSMVSGPATVSGGMLTITGTGKVLVKASQAGDATYTAAEATQSFTVQSTATAVTLDIDSVSGPATTEVVVPVRVKDFKNVLGLQGSITWNTAIADYVGVEAFGLSSMNAAENFFYSKGILTVVWADASTQAQSLADNAILFSLRLKLVGAPGASAAISLGNTPTPLFITTGDLVDVVPTTNSGAATILSSVSITGKVLTATGIAIKGVTITMDRSATKETVTTTTNGSFSFEALAGSSYTLSASKKNDPNPASGVTTLDVMLIQRHILNSAKLDSPYKLIAADVNQSGTVTTLDLALIRSLILVKTQAFPGNRLWAFVNSDFPFIDPANPFPFDSVRAVSNATTATAQNLIGVKLGDVNDSWQAKDARIASGEEVLINAENATALPGETVEVPIRVNRFHAVGGYQFTLNWDASVLEYQGVVDGQLKGQYGVDFLPEGKLTTIWNQAQGSSQTLEENATIFTVRFKVKGALGSYSPIRINSSLTPSMAYSNNLTQLNIQTQDKVVSVDKLSLQTNYQLFQNQPNPFEGTTRIRFILPEAQAVSLTIYNSLGQIIRRLQGNFIGGENALEWDGKSENGVKVSSGNYFYQMKTESFQAVKQLVIF